MSATAVRNYSGYAVRDRAALLTALAAAGVRPHHEHVIAEHITYRYPDRGRAPAASAVRIIAHASSNGVQALLVEIDGNIVRPDGRLFHITLSLAPGRRPVESNALLARATTQPLPPISVAVDPF